MTLFEKVCKAQRYEDNRRSEKKENEVECQEFARCPDGMSAQSLNGEVEKKR
jgi:hypothetical protein